MRAVIFANGEFPDPRGTQNLLRSDDLVIAADGGAYHALAIGIFPHVIIGDLDSLSTDDKSRLGAAGSRIISFSSRKDETDLELALGHAVRHGATEIIVLAALGGRLDQTMANRPHCRIALLDTLEDIDDADDFFRWRERKKP